MPPNFSKTGGGEEGKGEGLPAVASYFAAALYACCLPDVSLARTRAFLNPGSWFFLSLLTARGARLLRGGRVLCRVVPTGAKVCLSGHLRMSVCEILSVCSVCQCSINTGWGGMKRRKTKRKMKENGTWGERTVQEGCRGEEGEHC